MLKTIAACYHPTTVLLIDDNAKYLLGIQANLDKQRGHYRLYSDPVAALDFLTQEYQPNPFTARTVSPLEEDAIDHRNIDINLRSIRDETRQLRRFEQISVIVVDQQMPSLKGFDLCRQIKGSPIKKLMLTGEVKDDQAIQAFNDGIIDKFLNKDADNFYEKLNTAIYELQMEYFRELSAIICGSLSQISSTQCLNDPVFIDFLADFIQQKNITEYYLADAGGSFMFLDFNGQPSWLVIKDEDGMASDSFLAEVAQEKLPTNTLNLLKQRKKVLYLHSAADYQVDPGQWEAKGFLHPAKTIEGTQQTYYYAYIQDSSAYDIQPGQLASFRNYLEQL